MKKLTRLAAFALAAVMLFTMLPMSAFALPSYEAKVVHEGTETQFETLAEALTAAADGDTVVLLKSVSSSSIVTVDKSITLDGANFTLTSTAARAINVDCEGDVTIKNLCIESGDGGTIYSNAAVERAINLIEKPVNLTLEKVTATQYFKYTVNVAASSVGSTINMTDCEFTGYAALNITGSDTTVNAVDTDFVAVNDASVDPTNGFAAISIGDYTGGGVTENVILNITGGNVSTSTDSSNPQFAVQVSDSDNTKITIKESSINPANSDVLLVTEGSDLSNTKVAVPEEYAEDLNNGTGAEAVVISDGLATPYNTVADAVAAAAEGDTVALIDDAPAGTGSIPVDKNITFDTNGKDASGVTLELAQGASITTDDSVTIVSGVDGSVVTSNNGVVSLQHVHRGDGWFNSDAAAHWEKCVYCGENLEFLGHGDANGDGYCDTCGWIMSTPAGRRNPSTGVGFWAWLAGLFA